VLPAQHLVLTPPQAGVFRACSAVCTHQGCTVSEVRDGTINCPCHGSRSSITDGSVVRRPAQEPRPTYAVTRTGVFL
ncbi:Rieske (2Fe-2S) protein, partial [Rhodococcus sp. IEGM 1351]|uniref:Rieske (2Fe-2S) protein n=1 Tax=Rhodococcus sp. IEGM 1351 TaxID=3047089 RepID=UPI0024B79A7F